VDRSWLAGQECHRGEVGLRLRAGPRMPASSPLVRDKRTSAGSTRPLNEHTAERAFALLLPERASIAIVLASSRDRRQAMTQTSNRFFDEVARLMNDAAGVAGGVRREFDTLIKTQAERVLRE